MQASSKSSDLIDALNQISKEKGIDKEMIFETIEASLVSACKKNFGTSQNIKVVMNRETGDVRVFAQKEVVNEVTDALLQISVSDARAINAHYNIGDIADVAVTPRNFGRIAAQTAKQVVMQKFREAEREILFNEYITKEKEVVTGIIQRKEHKNIIVSLGKIEACLPPGEQIPKEELGFQSRVKVYVLEVKQTSKGPQINVSRTRPELVKRLFEQEVPEVHDGTVIIKSISREAGSRTKISVYSRRDGVDPVGACVGPNGVRVNVVVSELKGEKIDIIHYSDEPKAYIAAALSPSKVLAVVVNEADMTARVVVPDHQLSLAIGKEGQNARLAAKLTGWKIDIKSESQAKQTNFISLEDYLGEGSKKQTREQAVRDRDKAVYDDDFYDDDDAEYSDSDYDDEYDDDYDDGYDDYDDDDDGYDDDSYDGDYDDDDGYDGDYDNDGYEDEDYSENDGGGGDK